MQTVNNTLNNRNEIDSIPGSSQLSESTDPVGLQVSNDSIRLQTLIENLDKVEKIEELSIDAPSYILIDMRCLNSLIEKLACSVCKNNNLVVNADGFMGFACKLNVKCITCEATISSNFSSTRVDSEKTVRPPFDVNSRIIHAFSSFGRGYNATEKFFAALNMKRISSRAYNMHIQYLKDASDASINTGLLQARQEVRKVHSMEMNNDDNDDKPIDIAVSFDGSWHKRGHTSLYGLGCVIELTTGYVIDYEVLSKYCRACSMTEKELGADSPEFAIWQEGHAKDCQKNYEDSSPAMEMKAAEILWKRSMQYGFRYTTLLSDGDAKTYNHILQLKIYGPSVEIKKEECINHVSKRLGTGLRQTVKDWKARGVTLSGRAHGSLTEVTIKKLTKYYHNAIKNNLHDVQSMKTAIYATLYHGSSTDEKPFHMKCPTGASSWCFFNRAIAEKRKPGSHKENVHTPINVTVLQKILPVYQRMASTSLLERCLLGRTQNSNECLHSKIWSKCPNEIWVSKRKLDIAAAETISEVIVGCNQTQQNKLMEAGISPGQEGKKINIL